MSRSNAMAVLLADEELGADTSGSGGSGGDDSVKEHFIERFTAMCQDAGVAVPDSLIAALATEADSFVSGFSDCMDDDGAAMRSEIRQLAPPAPGTRFRLIAGGQA